MGYLCENDLLSPKEGAVVTVEVGLLLEPYGVMGHPQVLRVGLHLNVDQSHGENQEDCESTHDHYPAVVVIEPADLFKDHFEVHCLGED